MINPSNVIVSTFIGCTYMALQLFVKASVYCWVAEMGKKHTVLQHSSHLPVQEADNEVTAFPRGSNDLAPQQHVLAYLVESRLIWDPFRRGAPLLLFPSRRRENEASHDRLSPTLTPDILLRSDNLLHTPPELMVWQVPVGRVRLGSGQIKVLTLSHLKMFTCLSHVQRQIN